MGLKEMWLGWQERSARLTGELYIFGRSSKFSPKQGSDLLTCKPKQCRLKETAKRNSAFRPKETAKRNSAIQKWCLTILTLGTDAASKAEKTIILS
jgi:hypothetical protein